MSITRQRRSGCLVVVGVSLAIICTQPVQAQGVNQGLNNEAYQVQRGMNSGMLNGAQGMAIDNQINQVQQQANMDRSMNGGHLTGAERQQIGSEMHAVGQNMRGNVAQNGYNPAMMNGGTGMFGGRHQHRHMNLYNQQMGQNQMGGNAYGYNRGGYPVQNGMYGQQGYGQQVYGQQGYGQYGGGQYGQYGQNGQQFSQGGGLGTAAQMLRKLF